MTVFYFTFQTLTWFEAIPGLSIGKAGLMVSWLFWGISLNWEQVSGDESNND